jgi:bifunctional DNA-binding transcriptional regulator/antitoxin component of YhaV-PrlF toxin-antitoxin module
MPKWHPKVVNKGSRQVSIPEEILKAVGLKQEDGVYVGVYPDDPRVVVLVPEEIFDLWIAKGRRMDDGLGS